MNRTIQGQGTFVYISNMWSIMGKGGIAPLIRNRDSLGRWVVSVIPWPFSLPYKRSRYPLCRRLDRPQSRSGGLENWTTSCTCLESNHDPLVIHSVTWLDSETLRLQKIWNCNPLAVAVLPKLWASRTNVCLGTQPTLNNVMYVYVHLIYTCKASVCTSPGTVCVSIMKAFRLIFFVVLCMNHIQAVVLAKCRGFLMVQRVACVVTTELSFPWLNSPQRAWASLSRLHDHTQTHRTR